MRRRGNYAGTVFQHRWVRWAGTGNSIRTRRIGMRNPTERVLCGVIPFQSSILHLECSVDEYRIPFLNSVCAGSPAHGGWPVFVPRRNPVPAKLFHRFGCASAPGLHCEADTGKFHTLFWWVEFPVGCGKPSAHSDEFQDREKMVLLLQPVLLFYFRMMM